MLKNHLTLALRNLLRHKNYALLNILGLAIGIAACLLLFVVISFENSFDTFHTKKNRIYRVIREEKHIDGTIDYTPGNPLPVAKNLKLDIPQFQKVVSIHGTIDPQLTILGNDPNSTATNKKFKEENQGLMLEPEFFEVFDYQWLAGTPVVLKDPNVVVLSQRKAEKYYGNWKDAIGQYIKFDNNKDAIMKVAGIVKNPPKNTDFPLDIIVSYETHRKNTKIFGWSENGFEEWSSTSSNDQIYVLLAENELVSKMNSLLKTFSDKVYKKDRDKKTHFLSPLVDTHFDKRLDTFSDHQADKQILLTLSLIGVLIIVMACINFVNLATAQAVGRSKEVGVRKVLGSNRLQLTGQFFLESSLIVLFATISGLILAQMAMPFLHKVSQVPTDLSFFENPQVWLFLSVLILVVSLLAGLYPALVMSGFRPIEALKNKMTIKNIGGVSLRRVLVVTQFAISQMLIIGTLVAVSQMNYIRNLDLGFEKEGVYIITMDPGTKDRWESFKNKLLQNSSIKAATFSSDQPSSDNDWNQNFGFNNVAKDVEFDASMKYADADYFRTFGLQFAAGQGYNLTDSVRSYVINETMAKRLGNKTPQDAIGKTFRLGQGKWRPIVGVVKDFKASSAREAMKPIVVTVGKDFYYQVGVKIQSSNLLKTVSEIKNIYETNFPEVAINGRFFEDSIEEFYKQEQQLTLAYQVFAGLAILISCLGLYGLVSFMAVQKTKEIGIRKVLGANLFDIVILFSKEFTILVILACLIAVPVAWYVMNGWLQNFAYRTEIGLGILTLAVLGSLAVAWLTVGYRAVRAALANPVKSLRTE
jgi:putative ABC transport system permease protein